MRSVTGLRRFPPCSISSDYASWPPKACRTGCWGRPPSCAWRTAASGDGAGAGAAGACDGQDRGVPADRCGTGSLVGEAHSGGAGRLAAGCSCGDGAPTGVRLPVRPRPCAGEITDSHVRRLAPDTMQPPTRGVDRSCGGFDNDLIKDIRAMADEGLGSKQIWLRLMDDHEASVSSRMLRHYVRQYCPPRHNAAKGSPPLSTGSLSVIS